MGQQRRAYVAQRIVAAPFEWRDKDEVGCDVQNHFVVEVAFDADALRRAFAEPPAHRFVVQVTGRGHSFHGIQPVERDEIRKLQGRHADDVAYRHLDRRVVVRNCRFRASRNQRETGRVASVVLRIMNFEQLVSVAAVYRESRCIAYGVVCRIALCDGNRTGIPMAAGCVCQ